LPPEALRRVAPQTLRLFRHEPETGAFYLSALSGLGTTGSYAWGRVGVPGLYALIGLDADALYLSALDVLATARSLSLGGDRQARRESLTAVVEALIRAPAAARWLNGEPVSALSDWVEQRGLPAAPFDESRDPVRPDELLALAERSAAEHEPPELQLMRTLRGEMP
jgi:hypothetical protein